MASLESTEQQIKYQLTITATDVNSTDSSFTMDDLTLGNNYEPLDVSFFDADGKEVKRNRRKREKKISRQTMPLLAFQIFEKDIIKLSEAEKEGFPVCQYHKDSDLFRGIFSSVEECKKYNNSMGRVAYHYDNDEKVFVIYSWSIFSTILFVQECLKKFCESGGRFVLTYRKKSANEMSTEQKSITIKEQNNETQKKYSNDFSPMLLESKNIILRGAPGTGKSYLAKQIAADIISDGYYDDLSDLTDEQKKQVEFVQFHPSYDYSDFVEGFRPDVNADGSMKFVRRPGIFMQFIERARKNWENSQKTKETIEKEVFVQNAIEAFFAKIASEENTQIFKTLGRGKSFYVDDWNFDTLRIDISIPSNSKVKELVLNLDTIRRMLESDKNFDTARSIRDFLGKPWTTQQNSYELALYKEILKEKKAPEKTPVAIEQKKNYVFIIDEINRGEISKIFGELFYSIDPGYRGKAGEISTQYAHLHDDPDDKFYIPENVYIIGTMNDIDRSVDSFDFAMRRRFRFVELPANDSIVMLDGNFDEDLFDEISQRMESLNKTIAATEGLNENYQIGAAYFLKLQDPTMDFEKLWTDYLQPLLQEYVRGMPNEAELIQNFKNAYGIKSSENHNESDAG